MPYGKELGFFLLPWISDAAGMTILKIRRGSAAAEPFREELYMLGDKHSSKDVPYTILSLFDTYEKNQRETLQINESITEDGYSSKDNIIGTYACCLFPYQSL